MPSDMEIVLENAGKRYLREWIFKNLSYTFKKGSSYAITGRNGSGKSTLAAVLSGQLIPSEGTVKHYIDGKVLDEHLVYRHTSLAAPYLELIEEFTLSEMVNFHFSLKSLEIGKSKEDVLPFAWLEDSAQKQVKHLSSGMKQRFKLALSFLSATPLLILDEPTSNLDTNGINWYLERLNSVLQDRLVVICSNQSYEYEMCRNTISIEEFK
ncbi:ATP-binding cassette domain-containing protein [uncultured Imperialibacter sp.]|uniref:ABC transporter ATP-binding protein n=1 Tax=uncultured Imperialibacter sp. TaxID=1672639 RepID=UPI0030D94A2E